MGCYVSALDMFSIGIGPSSSHTVGPMRAGADFAARLAAAQPGAVTRLEVVLFGSLGATGIGHGTPDAVVAGLLGMLPESCDPAAVRGIWSGHVDGAPIHMPAVGAVPFSRDDVRFAPLTRKPAHANALNLRASGTDGSPVLQETYYSIGGGFIRREGDCTAASGEVGGGVAFETAADLLRICGQFGLRVTDVARACERTHRPDRDTDAGLDAVWAAMRGCIDAGLGARGTLPGPLRVPRRAAGVQHQLEKEELGRHRGAEWLQVYALAVNEANASGERVVTAPTNGAAGIIPAVVQYFLDSQATAGQAQIRDFLLTASAIGSLIKANASISGAEGGCQAEVGSACAMAAAGLCAVLDGTAAQVENAAEIAMEHHLGLTCDPIGGLVQVPCIERNAIAASTAVTAARLALHGDGRHIVSLDAVIATMHQTGLDMNSKYKETSTGGLAVNVVEC